MASITIRKLDDEVKTRLRLRAAANGRSTSPADCQIAAIALSRDMALATRNLHDFADMGAELIDPWAAG